MCIVRCLLPQVFTMPWTPTAQFPCPLAHIPLPNSVVNRLSYGAIFEVRALVLERVHLLYESEKERKKTGQRPTAGHMGRRLSGALCYF